MGIVDSLLDIGSKILDRVIPDSNARALAKEELNRAVLEEGFQIKQNNYSSRQLG